MYAVMWCTYHVDGSHSQGYFYECLNLKRNTCHCNYCSIFFNIPIYIAMFLQLAKLNSGVQVLFICVVTLLIRPVTTVVEPSISKLCVSESDNCA